MKQKSEIIVRYTLFQNDLMKMRSVGPGQEIYDITSDKIEFRAGDLCPKGFPLRPHIVWFGEDVPNISYASEIVKTADVLVVIGTSMKVYPAAGLVQYARHNIPVYFIDPHPVEAGHNKVVFIQKGASEGVKELKQLLI